MKTTLCLQLFGSTFLLISLVHFFSLLDSCFHQHRLQLSIFIFRVHLSLGFTNTSRLISYVYLTIHQSLNHLLSIIQNLHKGNYMHYQLASWLWPLDSSWVASTFVTRPPPHPRPGTNSMSMTQRLTRRHNPPLATSKGSTDIYGLPLQLRRSSDDYLP